MTSYFRPARYFRSYFCVVCTALVILFTFSSPKVLFARSASSITEEIEWTWEVRPAHPDPSLPNVLLLGDSITRNYFSTVTKNLAGIANVYLMASSISVGDPRLPREIGEFVAMERVHFQVVHFNNGMHGWAYTEEQYKAEFPSFLKSIRKITGHNGALIWATTTPVRSDAKNGASNPRVDARNAIAAAFVQPAGIPIDDQHALMMQHEDLHQDAVHFNPTGSALQGEQAAGTIKTALSATHP